VTLTFYGAAGGVTGSKHLLDTGQARILLDCGTFQGLPDVRARNRGFSFQPDSIDAVILSHAHIDHCGMLPLLVKRGFTGPIYATPATCDVAALMLHDMARIEEYDAAYRRERKLGAPDDREPLFTRDDIPSVLSRFTPVPYARDHGTWQTVGSQVRLKFYDAGHILGSAVSVLEATGRAGTVRLGYSGDLGSPGLPLLHDPEIPDEALDVLLLESTYGHRRHQGLTPMAERLADTVRRVCDRGGKMVVPAFSLGRTQTLVYVLHKLTDSGRIPRFPIFVDSPLATDLTDVYRQHRREYDLESWSDFDGPHHYPLAFKNLNYTESVEESKALNNRRGPFMVISASGMCTAGRVLHHLRHSLADTANAVFITGYQAAGTLGRRLLEGAKSVEIFSDRLPVRAEIQVFNEFSAHADGTQLAAWAEQISGLTQIFLVHGEPVQAAALAQRLSASRREREVVQSTEGAAFRL